MHNRDLHFYVSSATAVGVLLPFITLLLELWYAKRMCNWLRLQAAQAELCCWTGPKLVQDTLLDKMPDSMRKDVEKLLGDIPTTRKRPERFTRKEQAKQAVSGLPAGPATAIAGPSNAAASSPQEDEVLTVGQ